MPSWAIGATNISSEQAPGDDSVKRNNAIRPVRGLQFCEKQLETAQFSLARGCRPPHTGRSPGHGLPLALIPSMTSVMRLEALSSAIALVAFLSTGAAAQSIESQPVAIHEGTATFDASTNLPAIKIRGKSERLQGRARIRKSTDGLVIERLEAILPVGTLKTGMPLRDEHMIKYVFTSADGKVRDMHFVAERTVCSGAGVSHTCKVSGDLSIRNLARPFEIILKVNDDGSVLRAGGDGVVRLSAYAIAPPSQLGVKTLDDVKLHMDFVVKRVEDQVARDNR